MTTSPSTTTLSAAERKALKARAHPLKPVVMIGDAGLSPGVLAEVERGLASHELIKIRVASDERSSREALLAEICTVTGATAVQHIGKILVIWRKGKDSEKTAARPPKKSLKSKKRVDPRVRPGKTSRVAKTEEEVSDPRRRGRILEQSARPSIHRKSAATPGSPRLRPVKQNSRRLRSGR